MLLYLNQSLDDECDKARAEGRSLTEADLVKAVRNGALLRLRPIVMTVATIVVGLLPIMLGDGTGSEVMQRIAAPMVGGMVSATLLTLALIPAVFLLWQRRRLLRGNVPVE
jgi:Cu(I)/Ag(I) efflux system membrane protein CusA/SilA